MLSQIGVESVDKLFSIPPELKLSRLLDLPSALSETETLEYFRKLAEKNRVEIPSFLGAGAYHHFIPTLIDTLISRSEFFTSYTPYQPEISQGTLQAIFEFQTMICELTGMDVANASLYDGSTAAAEAVLMAARINGRHTVALAGNLHPEYREVIDTYNLSAGLNAVTLDVDPFTGTISADAVGNLDQNCSAILVQSPNFFGGIEKLSALAEAAHQIGALLIVVVAEAMSLGALKDPGSCGADIVCGESQAFGIPISFGGSYCGFFAVRDKYVRQIPGRLVGEALDGNGRKGYVLTLATREQHIRREKATSNICTNQGLYALMSTIYLSTMGRNGLSEVAGRNAQKAHYAAGEIRQLDGFKLRFSAPFFNEFVVTCPVAAELVVTKLTANGMVPGLPLSRFFKDRPNDLLVCVTETNTRSQIDSLVTELGKCKN